MKRKALTLCAAVLLASVATPQAQRGAAGSVTAIVGGRLVDGTGAAAVNDSVILVSGDRITAAGPRAKVTVPQGATIVNAAGKTVIPGLVDAHCHLNQPEAVMRKLLPVSLQWGVTTLRMTGNDKPEIMHVYHEAKAGKFLSPRVYTAGQGFNLTGPYPGAPTLKPTTPEEARKGVLAHKAQNVDFIKLWMSDKGGFAPDVVAAIVDEAKKQNIPVVAHIGNAAQVKQLAELGVTDFMHEARDGMNPEFIAYAKSKGLSFTPTLGQGQSRWYYYEHPEILTMDPKFDGFYARGRAMLNDAARKQEILGAPDFEQVKQRFKDNNYPFIKMMSDNGVRVITGTDCGAEASQTTPVGHTTHREVQMFVEAGLSPLNAIRAATLDAARVLERTENPSYGSIQAGKIADLVLLTADPTADIMNTIKIDRVMRAGRWVQ
jgi:imidazolonepropionase-like amidohydrolase